jgi:chromosome segregation ATPase
MLPVKKFEHKIFVNRPSSAAWKIKSLQKKIESMKKSQSQQNIIQEKINNCKELKHVMIGFIEEKKTLLEKNQKIQDEINECIRELQLIRRNNENMHQKSITLAKNTKDMELETSAHKKEQQDINKALETLQKEISIALKTKYLKENEYLNAYNQLDTSEKKVKSLTTSLKELEHQKSIEIDNSRKFLKQIKAVKQEIDKINKSKLLV